MLVRIALSESTKFDEFGLAWFQCQIKLPKTLTQYLLESEGI